MDNPETPGLRLLALDGGGIRGLSMLIILEHLMNKLKVEENLPAVPLPCDYFDLIGGTGTGGLIALMLGRLRMSVKDAVKAYGELAKEIFSDVKPPGSDGRFKASKLERAIKEIVRARSALQDPEEGLEDTRDNACRMFVCTATAANMSLPVLLRTYNTPDHPAMDCTIWQAGRATSAAPTFFKQIKIGHPGMEEAFLDGGMGYNNPTAALLLEAKVLFPDKQIACIISLGTGQPHTINIPKSSLLNQVIPLDVIKAMQKIATDCEKEHQSFVHHFDGIANLYFRFNVEQGIQNNQLNQWENLSDVAANTREYIQSQLVVNQLADAVKSLSGKIGRVPTIGFTPAQVAPDEIKQSEAALALVTTWEMSFKKLSPLAAEFLQMCSLLHHQNITEDIFKQAATWTTKNEEDFQTVQTAGTFLRNFLSASGTWDPLSFRNIIAEIQAYSLIEEYDGNTLSIHPQIQLWCQTTLKDELKARECMIDILGMSVRLTDDSFQFRIGLMPHVDVLIQSPATVKAVFQSKYAQIYCDSGRFKEAEFLEISVLEKQKRLLGADHPDVLLAMGNLASTYRQLGRYQEAVLLEVTVLEKQKTLLGADHPDTLLAMANLASTYSQLGRYQEAEFLGATVLEKRKTLFGADHPDTLRAIANLASTYSQLGRYQEAVLLETTVLEKQKTLLGTDRPDTLRAMANLASTYSQLGRYQDSVLLEATVLEKWKTLLGADHPETLLAMANLASTYGQLGRYQEAELLGATVLEKRKTLFGADHPHTLCAMVNLASTYSQLGRYQEAVLLEATVLEKRKILLGANHPDTLLAMGNLASTYGQLGRYQDAELLGATVLEKRKTLLGADHPHTLLAMANLASTYSQLGRYQDAELLEATVLEKRKTFLGANHPDTLRAMANLAMTYSQLGIYEKAKPLEATVLEKRKTLLGANHPETLAALENLVATYHKLGKHQEAKEL